MYVCAASDPSEMGQSSSSQDNILSGAALEHPHTAVASSSSSFPPVATVMPLHTFPSPPSVPPTAQWTDQQTAGTSEPSDGLRQASAPPGSSAVYFPVAVHWFYCRNIELRQIWQPFSITDSANLESAHQSLVSGMVSCSPENFWTFCM